MTDQEILDYYDSHLDVTIAQLSKLAGKSTKYVKDLLLVDQISDYMYTGNRMHY